MVVKHILMVFLLTIIMLFLIFYMLPNDHFSNYSIIQEIPNDIKITGKLESSKSSSSLDDCKKSLMNKKNVTYAEYNQEDSTCNFFHSTKIKLKTPLNEKNNVQLGKYNAKTDRWAPYIGLNTEDDFHCSINISTPKIAKALCAQERHCNGFILFDDQHGRTTGCLKQDIKNVDEIYMDQSKVNLRLYSELTLL